MCWETQHENGNIKKIMSSLWIFFVLFSGLWTNSYCWIIFLWRVNRREKWLNYSRERRLEWSFQWYVWKLMMVTSLTFQRTWLFCGNMMTSSNGNISALLALCEGNSPVTDEFPSQRPVTRSFGVFFDLRLNKQMNKQSWGWWFETPSRSLWRHCSE